MDGLGIRLKAARVAAGLTQQALAERAETSISVISTIETGRDYVPGLDLAKRLADACGTTIDQLASPPPDPTHDTVRIVPDAKAAS